MTNIVGPVSGGTTTGTGDHDIIIGQEDAAINPDTINGLGGNDVIFGDHDLVWVDADAANSSFATARNIDNNVFWSRKSNPDVFDDSIPYTSVLATGAGNNDFYSVTVGVNETITIDVDYGGGLFGGPSFDSTITLLDSANTQVPDGFDNDGNPATEGGAGSSNTSDSFMSFTNTFGSAQVFTIQVGDLNGTIPVGATYMLNVSVTNHSNSNTAVQDDDTLDGGAGNDILYGLDGNDLITGGPGADIIDGGANGIGGDTASYAGSVAGVHINLNTNSASRGDAVGDTLSNIENVIGSASSDSLEGEINVDNILHGGNGQDGLHGNSGVNHLFGGADDDILFISGGFIDKLPGVGSSFDGGSETDILSVSVPDQGHLDLRNYTISNMEILLAQYFRSDIGTDIRINAAQFTQNFNAVTETSNSSSPTTLTVFMDTATNLDLSGVTFTGFLNPNNWVNILGDDDAEVITGSEVKNIITGAGGNDTIFGNSFIDNIDGGIGADIMAGDAGDDGYVVDNVGDVVTEHADEGDDQVYTSVSYDVPLNVEVLTMTGGDNIDATGTASRDIIQGNSGNNTINGAGGIDVMRGRGGNDTYAVDNINDAVIEAAGEGSDVVYSSLDFRLSGNVETLILTGSAVQGFGDDTDNQIFGNDDVNVLFGMGGTDYLLGFGGDDIFVITPENGAVDVVADFADGGAASGDRIGISGFGAGAQVVQVSTTSFEIRSADNSITQQFILQGHGGAELVEGDDYYFA